MNASSYRRFGQIVLLGLVVGSIGWRAAWLAAGLPNIADEADRAAEQARSHIIASDASIDQVSSDPKIGIGYFSVARASEPKPDSLNAIGSGNQAMLVSRAVLTWRISFASDPIANEHVAGDPSADVQFVGIEIWDEDLPVWITSGRDGKPGWKDWDDDGNGITDDVNELGAAWSDDYCVIDKTARDPEMIDSTTVDSTTHGPARVLDHGAFRRIRQQDREALLTAPKLRYVFHAVAR